MEFKITEDDLAKPSTRLLLDIEAKASSDANNTNVSASFDILLIKND